MKVINAVTICNLISAHLEGDNEKFLSYANFIAEAYRNAGEERSAEIIQKRIGGSYKNDPVVTLDCNRDRFAECEALKRQVDELKKELEDAKLKMSYMVNPNVIGERNDMGW